jgi:hypothetical protein
MSGRAVGQPCLTPQGSIYLLVAGSTGYRFAVKQAFYEFFRLSHHKQFARKMASSFYLRNEVVFAIVSVITGVFFIAQWSVVEQAAFK